jgi:hypothetical protein
MLSHRAAPTQKLALAQDEYLLRQTQYQNFYVSPLVRFLNAPSARIHLSDRVVANPV